MTQKEFETNRSDALKNLWDYIYKLGYKFYFQYQDNSQNTWYGIWLDGFQNKPKELEDLFNTLQDCSYSCYFLESSGDGKYKNYYYICINRKTFIPYRFLLHDTTRFHKQARQATG